MLRLLHWLLNLPRVFEWQQRLCNNYSAIRRHFSTHLEVSGKDVLDIGCSTGTCASRLIDMTANRYTGIDIEARYVTRARKLYPAGRFEVMDARSLKFPDASFDVILFVGALHHMSDAIILDCFAQIKRVLRPDGVVLCAEPVFTPGKFLSNFLLRNDRGRHIRDEPGYRGLFHGLHVARRDYFRLSVHRFCSFVLKKTCDQEIPVGRAA
jgi:ubiquinone/menaquinone biosynthesis C-methylase UbiE